MPIVVVFLAVAAVSPVQKAEQLYQQARYEDALKALGTSCDSSTIRESEQTGCEKTRAFSLVALGREAEARAAFDRLLIKAPDADLGRDVSPKLQSMFSGAKRDLAQVMALQIEPVNPGPAGPNGMAPWPLTVRPPADLSLASVRAYVASASSTRYAEIVMHEQNGTWLGMYDPQGDNTSPRYYLVATLGSGIDVQIGDSMASKALVVSAGGDPIDYDPEGFAAPHAVPDRLSATKRSGNDDRIAGLPKWAFWTVVGGSAVLVTVAVILVASRGNGTDNGAVKVGLSFQ
ncbi:MAG: hypothetical protein H7Z43_04160 [Clostridia bacterium]|nr:hypothetical protein [Deltaproteobacteria bacterium]